MTERNRIRFGIGSGEWNQSINGGWMDYFQTGEEEEEESKERL